jgi:tetratricopeptide (TPR) repeat protein
MQKRLLTFSALCVAGTVGGALLSGTALFSALIAGATGVASSIWATDLVTFLDKVANRFQGQDAVLQNDDLSKAVGRAISAVIAKTSREGQFQNYREPLRRLASRATTDWAELLQSAEFEDEFGVDSLREPSLAQLFAVKPADFAQAKALTPELWANVLNRWQKKEPEYMRDPQVMSEVAECLHNQFPNALREVLKEDFVKGGRAFGAMALDLFGMLQGTLQEQNELLERLTAGDSQAFEELAGRIESEFGNITQLLTELGIQLAEVETRILDHQDQGFQRIEAKLDDVVEGLGDLKRQTISVSLVIDTGRPLTSHWQGRQTELDTLGQQLEQVGLIGITGLGGYGKSALANKLYETVDFPQKIWATLSQPYAFGEFGRWILGQLGFTLDEKADDKALAQFLTQQLMEQRCLVVIDNLETLLDENGVWQLPGYEAFFLRWLEYGRNSVILVTSRERPRLLGQNCFWQATLTGLTPTDGMLLLQSQGVQGCDEDLQNFSIAADGHPLLLNLAVGLLTEQFGSDPDIADLPHLDMGLLEIVGLHRGDPEASVKKLFAASFDRLEERLQRLLCNVSVYRLPFTVAAATVMAKETALTWQEVGTQKQVVQDLLYLKRKSLLQEKQRNSTKERIFQFQPLIGKFLKPFVQDLDWAHNRAVFYYRAIANPTGWKSESDLSDYIEAFYHHCELGQYSSAASTIDQVHNFMDLKGYYRSEIALCERLVQEWKPKNKRESDNFGWALIRLGRISLSLSIHEKCISSFQKAQYIFIESENRQGESASLNGLGGYYLHLSQYLQAIEFYKKSLTIQHKSPDRKGEAHSLTGLGNAYNFIGKYSQAIDYFKKSLTIQREISDLEGEANSLIGIANAYYFLRQHPQAIDYCEKSLAIQRGRGDQQGIAVSLNGLGNAYTSISQYQQAIDHHEQSLVIQREISDLSGVAVSLNGLGNACLALGRYSRAIHYYGEALKISYEIGVPQLEGRALQNLSVAYGKAGRISESIAAYQKAKDILLEIGSPIDTMYPSWMNSIFHFAKKSWFHLCVCFALGFVTFPFTITSFIVILFWRQVSAKLRH